MHLRAIISASCFSVSAIGTRSRHVGLSLFKGICRDCVCFEFSGVQSGVSNDLPDDCCVLIGIIKVRFFTCLLTFEIEIDRYR